MPATQMKYRQIYSLVAFHPHGSEQTFTVAAATGDTRASRDSMRLLNFLVESFIGAFGVTRPKPEQQRTVALVLGGFLLTFFAVLFSLIVWMVFGARR
jgi:hypothetical protein